MDIISELAVGRQIRVSESDNPFSWAIVQNTQNLVIPTPVATEWEFDPTNTDGVTQSRTARVKFTPMTFDLAVDQSDATHSIILLAIRARQKLWFNVPKSDYVGSMAVQFSGHVTEGGDGGTENGHLRSVSVQPCGDVDEEATIAVVP